MLPLAVYERIYDLASSLRDDDVVEIGTAHGASAIAAAWGLSDRSRSGHVYTLDRLEGGSRAAFGSRTENEQIVLENLSQFGVSDTVNLLIGDAKDINSLLPDWVQIGLLILDADGRIHRDIASVWDRLSPDAVIVIDDYAPVCRLRSTGRNKARVDAKMLLTFELANGLVRAGSLERIDVVGRTLFTRRVGEALPSDFGRLVAEAYDKLVFMDAVKPSARPRLAGWLRASHPVTYRRLRETRARLVR